MGELNSDDHDIYYCGQESLKRNGVAITVNKRVQNAVLECSLKNDRMICLFPRQTIQYHSNPSLCFPGGSEVKAFACKAGDPGSIPGLGRSPGEGNGNLLQYSCLENPMDRGAW